MKSIDCAIPTNLDKNEFLCINQEMLQKCKLTETRPLLLFGDNVGDCGECAVAYSFAADFPIIFLRHTVISAYQNTLAQNIKDFKQGITYSVK